MTYCDQIQCLTETSELFVVYQCQSGNTCQQHTGLTIYSIRPAVTTKQHSLMSQWLLWQTSIPVTMLTWDQKQCMGGERVSGGGGRVLAVAICRKQKRIWAVNYLQGDFFFSPVTSMVWLLCWGGALHCTHLSESAAAMIGLRPAGVLRSSWVALWSDQRQLFLRDPLMALQRHVVQPDSSAGDSARHRWSSSLRAVNRQHIFTSLTL